MSIKDITLQLVLKFLKAKGYTESYLNLQNQSKTNLQDYPKQIEFFKKILLKGDFNEAVQFIWTFQQKIPNSTLKKLTLQIYKQKLYQLLENPQQTQLRNLFEKEIINVCSEDEYQHLFTLLTCRSVKQIPGMDNWSPIKGRYACFQKIQPHLSNFFNLAQFQKLPTKVPIFNLEEAVESFIAAQQKVEQRMEKSQNNKQTGFIRSEKQSKQSIDIVKLSKIDNQFKASKLQQKADQKIEKNPEGFNYSRSNYMQKQPYLNPNQNTSGSASNMYKMQNISLEQKRQGPVQELEMAQSRVEKSQFVQRPQINNMNMEQQNEQMNIMQASNLNKKYNPYIGSSNLSAFQKNKQENKLPNISRQVKIDDLEQQDKSRPLGYKQIRQKQKQKQKQKRITGPSYLKYIQKQSHDSEMFKQQVKRNIAYLDQNNNSMVEKQDQNENFTFSNGAEQSGLQDRNRRIFKLASFSDPKAIRTCQFSPSGILFALGTNSSHLKIYNVEELFQLNQYKQIIPVCQIAQLHTKSIYCLDWASNQKSIATCSNDLTIKITDFVDNYQFSNYKTNVIGRHESSVRMIKFNSMETKLISCGDDSIVKIWDIGKIKKCTNLKGHTQSISAFKFGQNEQDNIIYSVSKDCTVRKWDLRLSESVAVSDLHDCQLTYIANNIDRIVVSDKLGNVLFYNEDLRLQNSLKIHQQEIRSIDGTNYDDLLLTASFDGHICMFSQKNPESPNYYQHNEKMDDRVVFATFMNHPEHRGFASTSTLGICNIFSYE